MHRFFIAVLLSLFGAIAHGESRHALVIGNSAYEHARKLANPKNDATAVSAKFKALGFSVIERNDASLKDMKGALREFVQVVPEGAVALVYYAGHGVQIDGTNYLVPVEANMAEAFEVPDEALSMDVVLRGLEATKSGLNILVLDCCRDNPFSRSWRGTRSVGSNGLVMPADMPQGMFIAYATEPGKTAEDGDGQHSPYTAALLEELNQPGVPFEQMFKNVGARVSNVTNKKQLPWNSSKFYGSFSFTVSPAGGQLPLASPVPNYIPSPVVPIPDNPPITKSETPEKVPLFTQNQVFEDSAYSTYNAYSKKRILTRAQEKLKNAGIYKSTLDGHMGPGTQQAILAWQRQVGLPETGKLDHATLEKLSLAAEREASPPVEAPRIKKSPVPSPRKSAPVQHRETVQDSPPPTLEPRPTLPMAVQRTSPAPSIKTKDGGEVVRSRRAH